MPNLREKFNQLTPEERSELYSTMTDDKLIQLRERLAADGVAHYRGWEDLPYAEGSEFNPIHKNPQISTADRMLVKNFGSRGDTARDPRTGEPQFTGGPFPMLQEKYPHLDFKRDQWGEIIYRERGGNSPWHRMDPSGTANLNPLEMLRDVGDVAYDIPASILEAGATALGLGAGAVAGVAGGGAVAGPLGATIGGATLGLGGAVGASGATAAGTETLRQGIGMGLGVNQEMDPGAIAGAGLVGAALPFLGGPMAKGAKQSLAKQGLDTFAIEHPFRKMRQIGTDMFQWGFGGASPPQKRAGREYIGRITDLEKKFDDPLVAETQQLKHDIAEAFRTDRYATWREIADKMARANQGVDISKAREPLERRIAALRQTEAEKGLTAAERSELAKLQKNFDDNFIRTRKPNAEDLEIMKELGITPPPTRVPVDEGGTVGVDEALAIKQRFQDMSDYGRVMSSMSPAQKAETRAAREVADGLKTSIEQATAKADKAGVGVGDLNQKYRNLVKKEDVLKRGGIVDPGPSYFDPGAVGDPQRVMDTTFTAQDKNALNKFLNFEKGTNKDLYKAIEDLDIYNQTRRQMSALKGADPSNIPADFLPRIQTINAAQQFMSPKKAGIEGVGAGGPRNLRSFALTGTMGVATGATASGGDPLMTLISGAVPLGLHALSSPFAQRQYLRMGDTFKIPNQFSIAPDILRRQGTKADIFKQSQSNPWGRLDLDERRQP